MKTRLNIDALRNYGHHFIFKSIGFTDKELTRGYPARRLDVELSDEELEKRRATWTPPPQTDVTGVLTICARLALQAD